jgi:hypothetical protein
MLGSNGNAGWFDLSDYVVHFTKGGDTAAYNAVMAILGNRVLRRGPAPFGAARDVFELTESQRCVCFSEVPLGFLDRIANRRQSSYGLVFSKRFLLARGGAPLWYLEHGTAPALAMTALIDSHRKLGMDPSDPLWRLTPLVDYPSGPTSPYTYDFRWEREWRIASDLVFAEADVAALLIPEHNHGPARSFFEDAVRTDLGPGYFCPYIDPQWPVIRVQQALKATLPQS